MVDPHIRGSLVLAFNKTKSVLGLAADLNLRGERFDSTDLAVCGAVVAGEREASGLDAWVLAEEEVGDVDVLICGWVGGTAAAVRGVRAVCRLRSRSCESNGEEGCGGQELHFGGGIELVEEVW